MKVIEAAKSVNGILLLNKAQGMSSNRALQKAKRLFAAQKAGHTGSLDPLATGMLPLCFGEATKVCQYLLDADKAYVTTGRLGIKTTTADSTGEILASVETFKVSQDQLLEVLQHYQGNIMQVPSMYSALKHKGRPLYSYARAGQEIERAARPIVINQLHLDTFDGTDFSLTVKCSKGTYIRNLVEDIGEALQIGAHVTQLHRLYTSGFANMPMYSLEDLAAMDTEALQACLLPMDIAVEYLPKVNLTTEEVLKLRQGLVVSKAVAADTEACLRLYDETGNFVGIGIQQQEGCIKAKRLLAF